MTRRAWVLAPTRDILEQFPHARQVLAVETASEKRRPQAKQREREVRYFVVTGAPGMRRAAPARLAAIIRKHWGIENRLHHVLDRTLREDAQRTRVGGGALVLSMLRKCSLALLRTGLRGKLRKAYLPEVQAQMLARPKRLLAIMQAAPA